MIEEDHTFYNTEFTNISSKLMKLHMELNLSFTYKIIKTNKKKY